MRINIHGAINLESRETRMIDGQTVGYTRFSGFVGAF